MKNLPESALVRLILKATAFLSFSAASVSAQGTTDVEIGLGIAAPTRFLNRDGDAAPLVRVGLRTNRPGKTVNYRFDLEGTRFSSGPTAGELVRSSTVLVGLVYSGIIAPVSETSAPYLILGAALHGMRNSTPDSWPGALFGLRGGFGWQTNVRGVRLGLEASAQLSLLGIPGGRVGSGIGTLVPVTVSFRF